MKRMRINYMLCTLKCYMHVYNNFENIKCPFNALFKVFHLKTSIKGIQLSYRPDAYSELK